MSDEFTKMSKDEFTAWLNTQDDISLEDFDAAMERFEPEPARVSTVSVAESAHAMADAWGNEKLVKMYTELLNQDKRLERANKWLVSIKAKGYSDAQAQLIAFALLERVNTAGSGNRWMNDFTERIREQLVDKLSAFGAKAYPMTDKQFDAAVRAAW